jgi:hypothetical protein
MWLTVGRCGTTQRRSQQLHRLPKAQSPPGARNTNRPRRYNASGLCEHAFGGDRAAADAHAAIGYSPFPTHASRRRECGAAQQQASDRAHRIGQERPVTVYRLVTAGTIEERIVELHHRKRELSNSLLEGAESAGKISQEELIGLLSG